MDPKEVNKEHAGTGAPKPSPVGAAPQPTTPDRAEPRAENPVEEIPDPSRKIARYKAKLPKGCSVLKSPYCDHILVWRMRGDTTREISQTLAEIDPKLRIPASTIWRNLKEAGIDKELPQATVLMEELGDFKADPIRELQHMIIVQRRRVDQLLKLERDTKKKAPAHHDPRIRVEMQSLQSMVRDLHEIKSPKSAGAPLGKFDEDQVDFKKKPYELPQEAEDQIAEVILGTRVAVTPTKSITH